MLDTLSERLLADSITRRGTKTSNRVEATIETHILKAENSIVENIAAKARFETQQASSDHEEGRHQSSALVKFEGGILCQITNAAEAVKSPTDQRALVLSYSGQWLENLVADWTNISELPPVDHKDTGIFEPEPIAPQGVSRTMAGGGRVHRQTPPTERLPSGQGSGDKPASDAAFDRAFKLKTAAAQAKEKVRDNKAKEKETQSAKAKTQDKDEGRDRSDKESQRIFVRGEEFSSFEDYFQGSLR